MRLQLVKIRLVNWKCYRDQEISLNPSEKQNIAVIFGNNGFGKTSLLEAVRFCLYGTEAISKSDVLARFNRIAIKDQPALELSVQLTLTLNESVILITRTAKRVIRGASAVAEIDEPIYNCNGVNISNPREQIENILPSACSEFYFFDGVEIKRYAQKVHSPAMRDAIERILGIPELRNLRDDSRKALALIDQELSTVQASAPELQRATENLQSKLEEQDLLNEQLVLAQSEYSAAQNLLEGLKAEAGAQETLRVQLDQVERKARDIDRVKRDLNDTEITIKHAMRQIPISLLQPFVSEIASDLQRKSMTTTRRSALVSHLRHILENSVCLCGRELDEPARQFIQSQVANSPASESSQTALIEDVERAHVDLLALHKSPNFGELLTRQDRLADDLDGLEQELKALRGDRELPSISLADLWRKVGEAEANVRSRRDTIESLRRDQDTMSQEINELRRQREFHAAQSAATAALGREAALARRLLEASEELISWRVSETRDQIETTTTTIHLAVTNKPDEYLGVDISADDYSLRIRSASGQLIDPDTLSAGEKEALAFAFIAGLNVASGKSAPFVMDTPFGHLDVSHQRNLVMALPTLPSQVVLLATDRDLPEPLMRDINDNISETLTISRVGATEDASVIRGD